MELLTEINVPQNVFLFLSNKNRDIAQEFTSRLISLLSAIAYSIVETAKENQLNPLIYLNHVFEQLPLIDLTDSEALDKLLPWSKNLPTDCHVPNKTK